MSGETNLHPELEGRLISLAARIAKLRQQIGHVSKAAQIDDTGELVQLEHRYGLLKDRFDQLERDGSGFRQEAKAEIETMTSEVEVTIEDSLSRIDRARRDRIMGGLDARKS
ncbi:MAG: hypothetical protein ABSD74_18810 [Rhizomicrobium sp.]|jgi:archaellum component FlaC